MYYLGSLFCGSGFKNSLAAFVSTNLLLAQRGYLLSPKHKGFHLSNTRGV